MGVSSNAYLGFGYVFSADKSKQLLKALKITGGQPDPEEIATKLSEMSGLEIGCADMGDPYSDNDSQYFVYLDRHFACSSYGYDLIKDSAMAVKKTDKDALIAFMKEEKLDKLVDKKTPGWILFGQIG